MAETPLLVGSLVAGDIAANKIQTNTLGRLTLSEEARKTLLRTGLLDLEGPADPAWEDFEDALLEIMVPRRLVVGTPPRRTTNTPANETNLRPKPLEEQVPGAWNFY